LSDLSDEPKTSVAGSPEPQLPVLRFSLKQLFWWVTGACVLMAALAVSPQAGLSPVALLMAVSAVALHVGGTAIGTRLRAHANERQAWEAAQGHADRFDVSPPWSPPSSLATEPRPRSPLHGHGRPLRRLPLYLVSGAIFGGTFGAVALAIAIGERTTIAGVAVGALSMAVVGTWLAFVAASSWAIFRQGWHDAVAESRKDDAACVGQR
jgi:hypothetical protein